MNRRGFFAAVLAPLVVPWKPKEYVHYVSPWMPWPRSSQIRLLQQRYNAHFNAMIDNIYLSR